MLTFILIGGLIWLVIALVFVLAIALAARKSVSPVASSAATEATLPNGAVRPSATSSTDSAAVSVEEPVAT